MYNPAFQVRLAEARIEDLRRARVTTIRPDHRHGDRSRRAVTRWRSLSLAGMRRLMFADPRAN